ncbi:Protein Skeletor, isoforms D/E [Aphelenchoides besseyi]|nr:Protein Skeletor, isoforms D/E [Aphelenchoides besseyi]
MKQLSSSVILILLFGSFPVHSSSYYGVSIGALHNEQGNVIANVWLANSTVIQITEANLPTDVPHKFVLEKEGEVVEISDFYAVHGNGQRAYSSEVNGIDELGNYARAFIVVPEGVDTFDSFGLFNTETQITISSVDIEVDEPEPFCCLQSAINPTKGIIGKHYNVSTGPIKILDSKTFLISSFSFEGTRAPDGWVYAGTGEVNQHSGHKLQVLGRDEEKHCALHEHYDGNTDIVARLPGQLTVYDVEYLAIFCYQYDVDFGHVDLEQLKTDKISVPAYIPPLSSGPLKIPAKCD